MSNGEVASVVYGGSWLRRGVGGLSVTNLILTACLIAACDDSADEDNGAEVTSDSTEERDSSDEGGSRSDAAAEVRTETGADASTGSASAVRETGLDAGESTAVDEGLDASQVPEDEGSSLYGVGTLTFGDEGSNAYLLLLERLRLGGEELTLEQAREFAGQSDLATHDGAVLVASGDEPSITKFVVDDDQKLVEVGKVSFAAYGIASAAFWNNQFVAVDKAYMLNGASELIVWNPETMEIEGEIALPDLEERDGLRVVAGLADRSSVVVDGKFYLPLYWTDADYAERSDDSVIVVVDVEQGSVEATIAANCPGLDYATADDAGNVHFSNWTGGVGTYFVLGTAQNCIATLDTTTAEVSTRTFASITGGREGAAFKYVGAGRFVLSVFDEERAEIESAEDPFTPVGGPNWQLWSYVPDTESAAPIESVDWNSGAIIHAWAGGAVYSMVPGADYATTMVYELTENGEAEAAFAITGWSFRLLDLN